VVGSRRLRRHRVVRQGRGDDRARPPVPTSRKYLNSLRNYPGFFGTYTFTEAEHNGYPTAEVVMSAASSARDGTFALAPGYA